MLKKYTIKRYKSIPNKFSKLVFGRVALAIRFAQWFLLPFDPN